MASGEEKLLLRALYYDASTVIDRT